jgi:hypothetical protein
LRLAAAVLGVGCLAAAPAPAGPTAVLQLKSIGHGWLNPNSNGFDAFDNDHCRGAGDPSLTSSWFRVGLGKKVQPATVPADRRLYIRAVAVTAEYVTGGRKMEPCVNLVSFAPEPGHTYDVAQWAQGRSCTTTITDQTDGREPASFRREPLPWTCKL